MKRAGGSPCVQHFDASLFEEEMRDSDNDGMKDLAYGASNCGSSLSLSLYIQHLPLLIQGQHSLLPSFHSLCVCVRPENRSCEWDDGEKQEKGMLAFQERHLIAGTRLTRVPEHQENREERSILLHIRLRKLFLSRVITSEGRV